MNRQGYNQGGRDLAEAARGILIEMTGRACRTNVVHVFADEEKEAVTGHERNRRRRARRRDYETNTRKSVAAISSERTRASHRPWISRCREGRRMRMISSA